MAITNHAGDRAAWLAIASRITNELQILETQISMAMLSQHTGQQARLLMEADKQLGIAARALIEASDQVRQL